MDEDDIYNILSTDIYTSPLFAGVFARDEFVHFILSGHGSRLHNFIVVFNTHTSSQPGEHWMVFAKYKNKGYYFDSYGRHPAIYSDIAKVLKENFHQIIWNNIKLQGITTTACGDYCVLFALLSARKWSFTRIIQRFHSVPYSEWRDHAVRRLIIRLYGRKALASIRKNRKGLSGIDKLHINKAIRVVRLKNLLTNLYIINRIID